MQLDGAGCPQVAQARGEPPLGATVAIAFILADNHAPDAGSVQILGDQLSQCAIPGPFIARAVVCDRPTFGR